MSSNRFDFFFQWWLSEFEFSLAFSKSEHRLQSTSPNNGFLLTSLRLSFDYILKSSISCFTFICWERAELHICKVVMLFICWFGAKKTFFLVLFTLRIFLLVIWVFLFDRYVELKYIGLINCTLSIRVHIPQNGIFKLLPNWINRKWI